MFERLFKRNKKTGEVVEVVETEYKNEPESEENTDDFEWNNECQCEIFDADIYLSNTDDGTKVPRKRTDMYRFTLTKTFKNGEDIVHKILVITDIDIPTKHNNKILNPSTTNDLKLIKVLKRVMIIAFNLTILTGRHEYNRFYAMMRDTIAGADMRAKDNSLIKIEIEKITESQYQSTEDFAVNIFSSIDRLIHPFALYREFDPVSMRTVSTINDGEKMLTAAVLVDDTNFIYEINSHELPLSQIYNCHVNEDNKSV